MEKMRPRLLQIKELRGGTAMNRVLLNAVLFSCASHVLRAISPLASFGQFWNWLQDDLNTAPRKWFRPYQAHSRSIFGLPGSQNSFGSVCDSLLFRVLQAMGDVMWDKIAVLESWYLDDEALLMHPLEGWRLRGCLSTWKMAWQRAYSMGAVIRTHPNAYRWRDWAEVLLRLRGGGPERARVQRTVRERILEARAGLPLVRRSYFKAGLFEQTAKRLSRIAPNATVALLRLFLGGGFRIAAGESILEIVCGALDGICRLIGC